ncbi:V-type ATPase subunit [Nitrospira sp. Kam-Ns4a]
MDDYAYFNARVRAMQGRLLTREQYEALLAQDTTGGIVERLRDSAYAEALERVVEAPGSQAGPDPTVRLDEALRRDLAGTLAKLRRLASDRMLEVLEAILLRWDAYNLKTILRGKRAAAPIEEILAATVPAGILDELALAELSRAPTVGVVVDTLATWRMPLARPLRKGLTRLGESASLQPVEFELDGFAFAHALDVVADGDDNDAVVRSYLRLLVDRTNLLTALRYLEERSARSPLEAAHHFLEAGGRFTRSQYEAVVSARDLRHGLSLLAGGPFHWLAAAGAEGPPLSLPALERRLDRALLRETLRLSRGDPLGMGVGLAYLERKLNETRNLRMIARGKTLGMSREQIAEWLIIETGDR